MAGPSNAVHTEKVLVYLFFAAFVLGVEAQTSQMEETWSAACSSKNAEPVYPAAALVSGLAGSVSADIAVNSAGVPASVVLSGPASFAAAVRAAIGGTTFPAACYGVRLKVTFSFQTQADLPSQHYVSACFSYPPSVFSVRADGIQTVCSGSAYLGLLVRSGGLIPITVCEVLADPMAYDGKDIALLGRLDDSHFDGSWLSEDGCGSQLVMDGHLWPNSVWVEYSASGPTPPMGILVADRDALNEKLGSLRRSTFLKMEEVSGYGDGGLGRPLVRQHWGLIFGWIEAREQLRRPRDTDTGRDWGNGFGQTRHYPVQIVRRQENEFDIEDNAWR